MAKTALRPKNLRRQYLEKQPTEKALVVNKRELKQVQHPGNSKISQICMVICGYIIPIEMKFDIEVNNAGLLLHAKFVSHL